MTIVAKIRLRKPGSCHAGLLLEHHPDFGAGVSAWISRGSAHSVALITQYVGLEVDEFGLELQPILQRSRYGLPLGPEEHPTGAEPTDLAAVNGNEVTVV